MCSCVREVLLSPEEADHRQIPSFWEENPIYSSGRFTVESLLSTPKEQQDSLYHILYDLSLTSVWRQFKTNILWLLK